MQETTSITAAPAREVTREYQQAMDLHYQILANAETAATAMIGLCKDLKRMRDDRLYTELGYESFEEYTENAVGLKRRQAYNYISVLEKLPSHLLQSNAHLGITKLELLAQVPALDRDGFVEENDLSGMSAREVRELVEKVKIQGEQISLLESAKRELDAISEQEDDLSRQVDERDAELDRVREELVQTRARAAELERRPIDVAVQEPDEETLSRIRAEARAAADAEAATKIKEAEARAKDAEKAAREKAEKAAELQLSKARDDAAREAGERFKASLAAIEEEKAQALARASDMEKQLNLSGDSDTALFSFCFNELQENFNKIMGLITKSRQNDPDKAVKFTGALMKALDMLKEKAGD